MVNPQINWPAAYAQQWRELQAIDRAYRAGALHDWISEHKREMETESDGNNSESKTSDDG
jgi:hypothetical protein